MTEYKKCRACGAEYPATTEFFYVDRKGRGGLRAKCKVCANEVIQRWKDAHPEKALEAARRWRENNPEKAREYARRYQEAHREEKREYDRRYHHEHAKHRQHNSKRWYWQNHEKELERARRKYALNPVAAREAVKRWRHNNPDQQRAHWQNRRTRQKGAEGTCTAADVAAQLKRQKGRCYYADCGHCKLDDNYHIEHVVPLHRGGRNAPDNIVLSCPSCNLKKGKKLPHEWVGGGRLL